MAIFRKVKKNNYSTIDNNIFKDKRISLKAKGLLCTMLSLPNNWNYSEKGLCMLTGEGLYSLKKALQELEDNGYLTRQQAREKGVFKDMIYTIYEEPMFKKPISEKSTTKNYTQLNTNNIKELNNNIKNKKEINKEKEIIELFEYDWLNER